MTERSAATLEDRARQILSANWTGRSTVPSRSQYPHQWGWDAAYIAIGRAHVDPRQAARELKSILAGQWADGRVPHIVFDAATPDDAYFPGPDFWRSGQVAGAPERVSTSGITQPPLHGRAALEVARRMDDPDERCEFLRQVEPALARQLAYLADRRDVAGDGLAAIVHPWESLDNSPLWDDALAAIDMRRAAVPAYRRRDVEAVAVAERPTDADYDRYVHLAAWYRDTGYDDRCLAEAPFLVEDPLFNAIFLWSADALAEIARIIGVDPEPHVSAAARIHDGLTRRLWDPHARFFWARDLANGTVLRRRTAASLAPLLDEALPREMVAGIEDALRSPSFFADGLGVATYDRDAADHEPRRYWRGPIWVNINWLLARGLRRHGCTEAAEAVDAVTVSLVERAGFREYFDARTGAGCGADDFSWTAALLLDTMRARTPRG